MPPPNAPVNFDDVLLCGVKRHVVALAKRSGRILWSTKLPGGSGQGFVTVLTDGFLVFAHTNGQVHALDFATGNLLWTNGLSGYGYGIASLCLPGATAPDPALFQQITADEAAASASHTTAQPL